MARADVAFTAVCIGVRKDAQRGLIATLDVQRVYKGIVPPRLDLITGGMKDASFRVHESYAVFMRADTPGFAHLCGGTRQLDAAPWPASFGAGAPPDPSVSQIAARSGDEAPPPAEPLPSPTDDPLPERPPAFAPPAPMAAAPAPAPAPPPEAAPRGGCAGCRLGAAGGDPQWLLWLLLFSRWLYRPRRRCRA